MMGHLFAFDFCLAQWNSPRDVESETMNMDYAQEAVAARLAGPIILPRKQADQHWHRIPLFVWSRRALSYPENGLFLAEENVMLAHERLSKTKYVGIVIGNMTGYL